MNRPATGVALAWLLLIAAVPLGGAILYLMIGERRIGRNRTEGLRRLRADFREISDEVINEGFTAVDWSKHSPSVIGMNELGRRILHSPTVCGSDLQMFSDTQASAGGDCPRCGLGDQECLDGILYLA